MRIPFPERIPLWYTAAFALVLFAAQLATGTNLLFALCCFFFILLSGIAFNVAGGLTRPSGSYVFFFALLAAIVGLVTKVIFREPANSRLLLPLPTIETYVGGMFSMLIAVYFSRRLSFRQGLLRNVVNDTNIRLAAIGCLVCGVVFAGIPVVTAGTAENVFTPFFRASTQLNHFLEVSIILGVTYQVRSSRGKSSLNVPVILAWIAIYIQGVFLGYSKEALFSPFVCWLAAAAVLRYNFRPLTLLTGAVFFLFLFIYMVPFCQYGRVFRSSTNTLSQNLSVSYNLFKQLPEIRQLNDETAEASNAESNATYFQNSHGLLDRLQMLSIDDALHVVTDERKPIGMSIVWSYLGNAVPRVIWRDKPDVPQANVYGHELGLLAPDDEQTAISVSPVGEAYRILGWVGIFVLAPVLWFILFFVMDSLCGDLRRSPWGILILAGFAHEANEGGLATPIYLVTIGLVGILFVVLFSGYILPLVATLVTPPTRPRLDAPAVRAAVPR